MAQSQRRPPRRNHWNGGDGTASLNELRRQREAQKLEAGRLELQRAAGQVIERSVVLRFIADRRVPTATAG